MSERETTASFMAGRAEWLDVFVVRNPDGTEEVVLRLDGTYAASVLDGMAMAEYFASWLYGALLEDGVPADELAALAARAKGRGGAR